TGSTIRCWFTTTTRICAATGRCRGAVGADIIPSMSVAKLAANAQSSSGYAVDTWIDMTLEPMTKVWQGEHGYSNFFFSEEDAREVRGAYVGSNPYEFAETLWRLAQVSPSAKYGYRTAILEYVVDISTAAAVGI